MPSDGSKEVDDYLAMVPPKFRAALQRLRKTIRQVAPDAEEVKSYGMPAIRKDGMLVYYAAFKDHCSFFAGAAVRERFARELKAFGGGKGTIQFTPENPIPSGLVRRIVKVRLAENAVRRARKKRRSQKGPARS